MSDPVVTAAEVPSVTIDTAKPAPALTAEPVAARTEEPSEKPPWLDERLERARKAAAAEAKKEAWKELGFESPEDAKKAAEERKAAAEAKKTESQKRADAETALKAAEEKSKKAYEALSVLAKAQMAALTDEQRAAVTALAGEDPAEQVKSIEALRPTWASAAPKAPADTLPAPNAPKAGATVVQADPKAVYDEWKTKNPIFAARFALENGVFEPKAK